MILFESHHCCYICAAAASPVCQIFFVIRICHNCTK